MKFERCNLKEPNKEKLSKATPTALRVVIKIMESANQLPIKDPPKDCQFYTIVVAWKAFLFLALP